MQHKIGEKEKAQLHSTVGILGHFGASPPAPLAAPAAHSSGSKLTMVTARRFVSLDVPELDAEVLDSVLEVGADGATRF